MTQLHKTPSLDADAIVDLVVDMSMALGSSQFSVDFSETEGVVVNLQKWSGPQRFTYGDFERILEILDEDPWGPKLENLRQQRFFDEASYQKTVRDAVKDVFPSFGELE